MKKLLLILLLLTPFICFAQVAEITLGPPEAEVRTWIGKDVFVEPQILTTNLEGFIKKYTDLTFVPENIFMPDANRTDASSYNALVNQVFKVTGVYLIPDEKKVAIELVSKTLGKCYYAYHVEGEFVLKLIASLKYPVGSPAICFKQKQISLTRLPLLLPRLAIRSTWKKESMAEMSLTD